MGHNPSRHIRRAVEADTQRVVDEYKARSIWGLWWSLSEETRCRFFNEDERKWIRRYGAELDEIACLIREPRNDREKHFLAVCTGAADPRNERERLWIRAQLICRFPPTAERAAKADLASHRAAALEAEVRQLRRHLREAEDVAMEAIENLKMHGGDVNVRRRRSICNIVWMSLIFEPAADAIEPAPRRFLMHAASRGRPNQVLPPSPAGIGQ